MVYWTIAAACCSLFAQRAHAQTPAPSPLLPGGLFAAVDRGPRDQPEEDPELILFEDEGPGYSHGATPLARRLAGVSIDRLRGVPLRETEMHSRSEKVAPPGLGLLDLQIAYSVRPAFVDSAYIPVLDIAPREESPQMRGVRRLMEKEFFRQVRRLLKKEWRYQLKNNPNLGFDRYEAGRIAISRIARGPNAFGLSEGDYYTSEFREDVFTRKMEGEEEIPVIRWGPLSLLDSGSINIDARLLRDLFTGEAETEVVEVAPDDSARRPLFSGKSYKVATRFRVDVDPLRGVRSGEVVDVVRSYGAVMEVTWLTDLLRRDRFVTEVEGQLKPDGEWRVFLNFVMKSR